jgi:hypothetical protein
MTPEELKAANLKRGYMPVSVFQDESILYKRENGVGGFTYYLDEGFPDGFTPAVWDTTIASSKVLKAIYQDINP